MWTFAIIFFVIFVWKEVTVFEFVRGKCEKKLSEPLV